MEAFLLSLQFGAAFCAIAFVLFVIFRDRLDELPIAGWFHGRRALAVGFSLEFYGVAV
jgi:hypothetical protein